MCITYFLPSDVQFNFTHPKLSSIHICQSKSINILNFVLIQFCWKFYCDWSKIKEREHVSSGLLLLHPHMGQMLRLRDRIHPPTSILHFSSYLQLGLNSCNVLIWTLCQSLIDFWQCKGRFQKVSAKNIWNFPYKRRGLAGSFSISFLQLPKIWNIFKYFWSFKGKK